MEGFCCPVPSGPRLTLLRRQGFKLAFPTALRGESGLSIVVIGNYSDRPDNGGIMPSKSAPFTPSSILFRPHQMPPAE